MQEQNDILKGFELNTREHLANTASNEYYIKLEQLKDKKYDLEMNKPKKPKEATILDFNFPKPQAPDFQFVGTKYDDARRQATNEFNKIKTLTSVQGVDNYQNSRKQYGDMLKMYTELKRVNKSRGVLESFFSFRKHNKEKKLLEEIKNKLKSHPFHDQNLNLDDLNALTQKNNEVANTIENEVENNNIKKVNQYNDKNLSEYNKAVQKHEIETKETNEMINDMEMHQQKYINESVDKYYDEVKSDLIKEDPSSETKINGYVEQFARDDKEAFEAIRREVNKQMKQFDNTLEFELEEDFQDELSEIDDNEKQIVEESKTIKEGLMHIGEFDNDLPIANNYESINDTRDEVENQLEDEAEKDF